MINKEKQPNTGSKNNKRMDTARMDVHAVLVIRDKTTKEILVNKRG